MSIDYGETIGFSIINLDTKQLEMIGSTKDQDLIISIFFSLKHKISVLAYESFIGNNDQRGVIREILKIVDHYRLSTEIKIISPSIWKNSPYKSIDPKISKHSKDSYRFAMYVVDKIISTR